jgi:hypothetical protein
VTSLLVRRPVERADMTIAFADIRGIIKNQYDPDEVRAGLEALDKVRATVRAELLKLPAEALLRRPRPGAWNIVEIIRHVVLSEDDRINYWILDNGRPPTKLGMPPHFLRDAERYREVGRTEVTDLRTVLKEWDDIHVAFSAFAASMTEEALRVKTSERDLGQGDVGNVIQRMIPHELDHYDTINRMLGE